MVTTGEIAVDASAASLLADVATEDVGVEDLDALVGGVFERVRYLVDHKRYSQREIGRLIGVTGSTVTCWYHGTTKPSRPARRIRQLDRLIGAP